ncbi:MAG: hypothetical protein RXO36_05945 [Candidatus Nanopusillus acidilobi]
MKIKRFKGFLMAFLILFSLFVVVNFTGNMASATNTYNITFIENGLPDGMLWFVTLNGTWESSTTNTIVFNVPNGTYTYTVTSGDMDHAPIPPSEKGTVTVNGSDVNIAITFSLKYFITVNETGLPPYIMYYFNVTYVGTNQTVYSAQLIGNFMFVLTNGTYRYTIETPDKSYAPVPPTGIFTVNGTNMSLLITFKLIKYNITFIVNGLPSGMKWYLNMSNGQSFIVTGSFTFSETRGTYNYTIASGNKDYAPSPSMGTFTVNDKNLVINITFTKITNTTNSTTTGSGFINLPGTSITILDITIFFIILVIVLLILASIYKETKSKRRR